MIASKHSNPCIRCGKARVTIKTRTKRVGGSVIVSSETACPDKECQLLVDKQLYKEKMRREKFINVKSNQLFYLGKKKSVY